MLSSQGLVLATAMAVSAGTIIILDLLRDKYFPQNQQSFPEKHRILRSCLTSSASEDVKDTIGNGEEYRRQFEMVNNQRRRYSCGNAGNKGMPETRECRKIGRRCTPECSEIGCSGWNTHTDPIRSSTNCVMLDCSLTGRAWVDDS
nr:uncharacterized protein LOC109164651 [Ipomoea batatas]